MRHLRAILRFAEISGKLTKRKIGKWQSGAEAKSAIWQSEIGNVLGAPAGIRTPNQQIMRRFGGHERSWTKKDVAVLTESSTVKVG